jgi:hypothetical protein
VFVVLHTTASLALAGLEAAELEAHGPCWTLFAGRQRLQGGGAITVTSEFGPDGSLPTLPFTNQPGADLSEINQAMAAWVRQRLE